MPKGSSSKSTAAIQRLLEERRQYEAWIARLDQAADATPAGVRSRVKSDYEARLLAVSEELKSHAEAARQLILQRKEHRVELQKKEARAAERLTETELRHAVGEYDESQWGQVHKDALAELLSIREELAAAEADIIQLEELDSLVRAKPGAGEKPSLKVGPPPKPGAPKKAVVDELAFLKSVTEDDHNAPSAKRALCRAALFLWISPRRAARSSTRTAVRYASCAAAADVAARTRLTAVRSAERCARLWMACARPCRIAFFADLILGTTNPSW